MGRCRKPERSLYLMRKEGSLSCYPLPNIQYMNESGNNELDSDLLKLVSVRRSDLLF